MTDPRRTVVAAGSDAIAARYAAWAGASRDDARDEFVEDLASRLPDGAPVLDLGCGDGLPTAQRLAARFRVTGVDVSAAQVDLARKNVPTGDIRQSDLSSVRFPDGSLAAVIALYSITHVPREDHAALLRRIAGWLRPGGLFLATLNATDAPDWTGDWLGAPMFFSGWDAATNRQLLRAAGFELVRDEIRTTREPDADVSFLWILARRPYPEASPTRPP